MTEEKMMREAREGKPQTADKKENERVTRMGSGNIPALVVEFAVPATRYSLATVQERSAFPP